jgi:two-component system, chemotaxis family, sensor kinase CheA
LAAPLNDDFLNELISDFVKECLEQIENVEPEMISASQITKELANKVFRPMHSIKGTAGTFGFSVITKVAHSSETLLGLFREEKVSATSNPEVIQIFLDTLDFMRKVLNVLEQEKTDEKFIDEAKNLELRYNEVIEVLKNNKGIEKSTKAEAAPQEIKQEIKIDPTVDTAIDPTKDPTLENQNSSAYKVTLSPEMLDAFILESSEFLEQVDQLLVSLTQKPDNLEPIKEAYRLIHSFKGNCGIFSLADLEKISHRMETIFSKLKDKELKSS